jgi:16S rRNA (adenine1518-N6/adenine1519-N6)-dimethyltransferase
MPAKPKLGQNFLHDHQAIQRIAASIGDCSGRTVVEIGPGKGAITDALAARAAHLLAIELDRELAVGLRSRFSSDKVRIVEQSVLDFDFAAASETAGQRLLVVGNLPYYITSPILMKLAENHLHLERAVLMVQREVADRLAAEPGSRDYGQLSVTVQMYGPVERLFTLPPGAFTPPPDVHSTVVRWRFAPRFAELNVEPKEFVCFLRQAFAQKRKTLANNLRAAGTEPSEIAAALAHAEVQPQARAEALTAESLAAVFRNLQKERATPQNEVAQN